MLKTEQIKTEQIREEFNDKFKIKWEDFHRYFSNIKDNLSNEIQDFWLQKLSEQRQSILEEVEKKIKDIKLPKSQDSKWTGAYNIALGDVLSIIKEK